MLQLVNLLRVGGFASSRKRAKEIVRLFAEWLEQQGETSAAKKVWDEFYTASVLE